jgi:hypothetical protein
MSTHNFRKPICIHGHDKRIVGITSDRKCRVCDSIARAERRKRKRRKDPEYRGDSAPIPNLRVVRLSLGLSLAKFGRVCGGLPAPAIHRIENGSNASRRTRFKIIAGVAHIQKKRRELYVA